MRFYSVDPDGFSHSVNSSLLHEGAGTPDLRKKNTVLYVSDDATSGWLILPFRFFPLIPILPVRAAPSLS